MMTFSVLHIPIICAIAEPRGSVRPNVRDKDVNGLRRDILVERMVGLPCPVQSFPAPAFRYRHLETDRFNREADSNCIVQAISKYTHTVVSMSNCNTILRGSQI